MLELLDRDAAGRITKWQTASKRQLMLPDIAIVIDPRKQLISPKELEREFKCKVLITNAYFLKKGGFAEEAKQKGLHKMLDFNGVVMNDSGAFQMMWGGSVDTNNREIIELQNAMKPDVGTFLDIPTADKEGKDAILSVKQTLERAKECKSLGSKEISWAGPVQGGKHIDLVAKSAKQMAKLDFDIYPVGSIVPRLIRYDFKTVADQILAVKQNVPLNKPVHAFGYGVPQALSFAVALGIDIFDCAAYALFAKDDRYMTLSGTHTLQGMVELPCGCPVCSKHEAMDLKAMEKKERMQAIARHNLYVTMAEIRTIRQAIRENWLWELVQQRARAHPALLEALQHVFKTHGKWLMKFDPVSKKSAMQWQGEESAWRPDVIRSIEWLKRVRSKKGIDRRPFGKVPLALKAVYPFSQSLIPGSRELRGSVKPQDMVKATLEYQFGKGAKLKKFNVELSKATNRIRRVWNGKALLGTIRASDGFFIPSLEAAKQLPMKRVYVDSGDIAKFVREGRSLFSKFVSRADDILPGEEIAVYHKKELIGIGSATLNSLEMKQFQRGVAVEIR